MAHVTSVTGAKRGAASSPPLMTETIKTAQAFQAAREFRVEAPGQVGNRSRRGVLALLEAGFITGSTSSVSRGQYSAARGNGLEKSRR